MKEAFIFDGSGPYLGENYLWIEIIPTPIKVSRIPVK